MKTFYVVIGTSNDSDAYSLRIKASTLEEVQKIMKKDFSLSKKRGGIYIKRIVPAKGAKHEREMCVGEW